MEQRETRLASDVYFGPLEEGQTPAFEARCFEPTKSFAAAPFKKKGKTSHLSLWSSLKKLYREQCKAMKATSCQLTKRKKDKQIPSWKEKVNAKRALIAAILKAQTEMNLAEVCRTSGCTFNMVKKVHRDLLFSGDAESYEYPTRKPAESIENFEKTMQGLQGSFMTISDLKRRHPDCSKKWIRRRIRDAGFRWRQLPKQRKKPKKELPENKKVIEVIAHLTSALNTKDAEVVYLDEVHFPLFQTAEKRWTLAMNAEDTVYNRRTASEDKLSVVAACNLQGFVGIQVFRKDVTCNDFLFLLESVLAKYPSSKKVTVLVDNATWHTTPKVMKTAAGQFLFLNVPGLYRANAIENSFSFVRSEFRKRATVNSLEEEAAMLVNIFFDSANSRRFQGIHKNHLRQLLLLLKRHSKALEDHEDSVMEEL